MSEPTAHPERSRGATLHLLCGKICAGKSTLARKLAQAPHTVLLREDEWLAQLYPGELKALADYVRCIARLRAVLGPHVEALLKAGVSVVLDFPANTLATRAWMKSLAEHAGVPHRLYYLDVIDEVCKERLKVRNVSGTHEFASSEAVFDEFTRYFVPPHEREGLVIVQSTGDLLGGV